MMIEVVYKNGHKERRICRDQDTVVETVQSCEASNKSKIKSIKVVKRDYKNQGNNEGG
jgi:hypothetical protein